MATVPDVTWEDVREMVNAHAANEGEWAGAPLPIHGLRLVVEKRHPWQGLQGAGFGLEELPEEQDFTVRNSWYCAARHARVFVRSPRSQDRGRIEGRVPVLGGRILTRGSPRSQDRGRIEGSSRVAIESVQARHVLHGLRTVAALKGVCLFLAGAF